MSGITEQQQKDIVRLYKEGKTWKFIRKKVGCKDYDIRRTLDYAKIKLRSAGYAHKARTKAQGRVSLTMDHLVLCACLVSPRLIKALHDIAADQSRAYGVRTPTIASIHRFMKGIAERK